MKKRADYIDFSLVGAVSTLAAQLQSMPRRHFLWALSSLALSFRVAGGTETANRVGLVDAARGQSFARLTDVRSLEATADIFLGDLVWTDPSARLKLQLDGGTDIHLGAATRLKIDQFIARQGGKLVLGEGALVFDRPDDLPKTDISVLSAFGLIGVRGTRFFAGPSRGVFGVFCERGEVMVQAAGEERRLKPGDGVDITQPGAPASAVKTWGAARIKEAFDSVLG